MVRDDGIDELIGQGRRVAAVVPVQDGFPAERGYVEQAVVRTHQEVPGGVVRQGMDMVQALHGRNGQVYFPLPVYPVKAAVPGAQPDVSVVVPVYGAYARGRTIYIAESRVQELPGAGVEKKEPAFHRAVGHPKPAVQAHVQVFNIISFQIRGEAAVLKTEQAAAIGAHPDAAIRRLNKTGCYNAAHSGNRREDVAREAVHGIVGTHPDGVRGVFQQRLNVAAVSSRNGVVDGFLSVEAVQPVGGAYPYDAPVILQDGPHGVGG